MRYKLPIEQSTKDESKYLKMTWDRSPFNYLLTRTAEKYLLKAVATRRSLLENQLNCIFPILTDEMLKSLYQLAYSNYINRCSQHHEYSGFSKTPSEIVFLQIIQRLIKENPLLKNLEVYPSINTSKDFLSNNKVVIGNHVPDVLIFGLKTPGSSAITIEINGDSHVQKYSKDELRNIHLNELKIFTWEIPNDQVTDSAYILKSIMEMYKVRNGSLNEQILRTKRAIWTKTISCQLSLEEIERHVLSEFSIALNLKKEASLYRRLPDCPRNIKKELSNHFELRS